MWSIFISSKAGASSWNISRTGLSVFIAIGGGVKAARLMGLILFSTICSGVTISSSSSVGN